MWANENYAKVSSRTSLKLHKTTFPNKCLNQNIECQTANSVTGTPSIFMVCGYCSKLDFVQSIPKLPCWS